MEITFVRHGRTRANVERRFQPPSEPLDDVGREQARAAAARLAGRRFEGMLCGRAVRVEQTAGLLLESIEVGRIGVSRALDEIDAGILTGLTFEEAHERFPELSQQYFGTWPDFSYPRGDTFARFYHRCQWFIQWVAQALRPGPWLLVGSEGAILAMVNAAAGRPPEQMFSQKLQNGGILQVSVHASCLGTGCGSEGV